MKYLVENGIQPRIFWSQNLVENTHTKRATCYKASSSFCVSDIQLLEDFSGIGVEANLVRFIVLICALKVEYRTILRMLMYGKEASNRKQEIDRQHYTIPNQRPKDKHCGKI